MAIPSTRIKFFAPSNTLVETGANSFSAPSTPRLIPKRKYDNVYCNGETRCSAATPQSEIFIRTPSVKRIRLLLCSDEETKQRIKRELQPEETAYCSVQTFLNASTAISREHSTFAKQTLFNGVADNSYLSPPMSASGSEPSFDSSGPLSSIPLGVMLNCQSFNNKALESLLKDEQSDRTRPFTEQRARIAIRQAIQNNSKLTQDYTLTALLGWGGNGAVLSAETRGISKQQVAIKCIYKKNRNGARVFPAVTDRPGSLPWEIQILSQIHHEHVLQYQEWFEDSEMYYLVTEKFGNSWKEEEELDKLICLTPPSHWNNERMLLTVPQLSGCCDLFSFIDYYQSNVPMVLVRNLFKQIATSVLYLHRLNVVHGDLKEENILVERDLSVKLCDFGHSRQVKISPLYHVQGTRFDSKHITGTPTTPETRKHFAFYGTTEMTAPELFSNLVAGKSNKSADSIRSRGFELDVWALGLLLYSMCVGSLPPQHSRILKGEINILKSTSYPITFSRKHRPRKDVSKGCLDLLGKMLLVNPLKRWTMDQVVGHPWLSQ